MVAPAWMMLMTQLAKVPRSLPLRAPKRHPPHLTAAHAAATSADTSCLIQPVRQSNGGGLCREQPAADPLGGEVLPSSRAAPPLH